MDLKLHANATTTPRTRAYIQQSAASNSALARELGIHSRTVARWKARQDVLDRSTCPHRLATTMTPCEETLVVELRRSLALPLDDICEAMRRCVNPQLSRSGIHRCLKRHGLSARFTPQKLPAAAFQTDAPAGFIHVDVKYLPPLNRRRSYAYVAIDRATRFVYLEILPNRRAETAAAFLERFLNRFPLTVHRILTDNGSEFTDRFAVDKKDKPHDKPSGAHPFDRACARHAIAHRLTRPFRPQTNGMVERFNRRLAEHLDRVPQNRAAHHRRFVDHAERDAYLHTFVADYNRTRLRSLDYHAPAELLAKLAGHNSPPVPSVMRFAAAGERSVEAHDAGCYSLLQPRVQRVSPPNAEPAEIEDLKLAPAPGVQSGDALQGLEIVIEGWTDKNPDAKVIAAARLLPIVKAMHQPLEP
jgi:transposase InsO family protein